MNVALILILLLHATILGIALERYLALVLDWDE